jgi:hypothetical protein
MRRHDIGFNPSNTIFLMFYTEIQLLHYKDLTFPYKGQLMIAIREAVYICSEKPLHLWVNVKTRSF